MLMEKFNTAIIFVGLCYLAVIVFFHKGLREQGNQFIYIPAHENIEDRLLVESHDRSDTIQNRNFSDAAVSNNRVILGNYDDDDDQTGLIDQETLMRWTSAVAKKCLPEDYLHFTRKSDYDEIKYLSTAKLRKYTHFNVPLYKGWVRMKRKQKIECLGDFLEFLFAANERKYILDNFEAGDSRNRDQQIVFSKMFQASRTVEYWRHICKSFQENEKYEQKTAVKIRPEHVNKQHKGKSVAIHRADCSPFSVLDEENIAENVDKGTFISLEEIERIESEEPRFESAPSPSPTIVSRKNNDQKKNETPMKNNQKKNNKTKENDGDDTDERLPAEIVLEQLKQQRQESGDKFDYEKAAQIHARIEEVLELEKQRKKAVESHDYGKAGELHEKIHDLSKTMLGGQGKGNGGNGKGKGNKRDDSSPSSTEEKQVDEGDDDCDDCITYTDLDDDEQFQKKSTDLIELATSIQNDCMSIDDEGEAHLEYLISQKDVKEYFDTLTTAERESCFQEILNFKRAQHDDAMGSAMLLIENEALFSNVEQAVSTMNFLQKLCKQMSEDSSITSLKSRDGDELRISLDDCDLMKK